MKTIAALAAALSIALVLGSCTKKPAEAAPETVWTGAMDVAGVPLSGTLTIFCDDSFTLDATVSLFGVGMNVSKVGTGTVKGDSTQEGELVFTLEKLSSEIGPMLQMAGAAEFSLPLQARATIAGSTITLEDIGLGQEIALERQELGDGK